MNKELILNRVLLRRETIDLEELFVGSIDNTRANFARVIDKLEKDAKKNDYDVVFRCDYYGYDGAKEVEAYIYRWETMKEYNNRIEMEQVLKERAAKAKETKKARALARAMETEADERALYEQLKKKFGA